MTLLVIGISICAVLAVAVRSFTRERDASSLLQLAGAGFLMMVVLAHIGEAFHLLPWMGWGRPNSAGHYIDLVSAVAGPLLFIAGCLCRRLPRRTS